MTISTIFKFSGFRRWLFVRWLRRNRTRLALLKLEGEHLSEFGRQVQRDMRRELSDRICGHKRLK